MFIYYDLRPNKYNRSSFIHLPPHSHNHLVNNTPRTFTYTPYNNLLLINNYTPQLITPTNSNFFLKKKPFFPSFTYIRTGQYKKLTKQLTSLLQPDLLKQLLKSPLTLQHATVPKITNTKNFFGGKFVSAYDVCCSQWDQQHANACLLVGGKRRLTLRWWASRRCSIAASTSCTEQSSLIFLLNLTHSKINPVFVWSGICVCVCFFSNFL